jgi:tripartite-type tricarboxylate transporter receptor subunit TctC
LICVVDNRWDFGDLPRHIVYKRSEEMTARIRSKAVLAAVLSAVACSSGAVFAQAYPSKPIRLIVPFPAGGGVDYIGRIVGKGLSERLNQQVVIDNRPGANGILALENLKSAPPDGYTIAAVSAGPLAVNPFIYKKLPYDTLKDFTQIANMVNFPLLLVSHPSLPVKNVRVDHTQGETRRDFIRIAWRG